MNKNFGLSLQQTEIIKVELSKLLKNKDRSKVFVFGSRSKGTERKYSDIDLWIESTPKLTTEELLSFVDRLDSSDLSIKVDIVTPESCLEQYRARILTERVFWF